MLTPVPNTEEVLQDIVRRIRSEFGLAGPGAPRGCTTAPSTATPG
jgi:hypothetical protein